MQLPAQSIARFERGRALDILQPDRRRPGEISRPGDEPGNPARDGVFDLVGGLAGRNPLLVGIEAGDVDVPPLGKLAPLHLADLVGVGLVLARVALEEVVPFLAELRASSADALVEDLADSIRDQELRVLAPPVGAPARPHPLAAQRLPAHLRGLPEVRTPPADVAVE